MVNVNIKRADRTRPEPLWHQAEQALRALIADGTWPDGTQLPNEGKLSEMLGVSRITIRHALRIVEESGLLRREHGRGTFVRTSTVTAGMRGLTSFTQEMAERGLVVGSRVLEMVEMPASLDVASALEITEGEAVVMVRRLRAGNNQPIGIQTAYLPAARVPGFRRRRKAIALPLRSAPYRFRHHAPSGSRDIPRRNRLGRERSTSRSGGGQPCVHRPAYHLRCKRTVRIYRLDHARRSL